MTIVLILCVCHIGYSALLNLAKIVVYQTKIIKAQELHAKAEVRNKHLKSEINNFNSMHKVESIARNNLKMAAKDEVLIIINQPAPEINEIKKMPENAFTKFLESFAAKFNKEITPEKTFD